MSRLFELLMHRKAKITEFFEDAMNLGNVGELVMLLRVGVVGVGLIQILVLVSEQMDHLRAARSEGSRAPAHRCRQLVILVMVRVRLDESAGFCVSPLLSMTLRESSLGSVVQP
jgi:hypothetical protein